MVKNVKKIVQTNPWPTVDIIIWDESRNSIVLIERKFEPLGWAIPGGFVDVGESLETAAVREAKEETSLDVDLICQFYSYSHPSRDTRKHTISTVFIGTGRGQLKAQDDAKEAHWYSIHDLPDLVFDHAKILQDFKSRFIEGEKKFFLIADAVNLEASSSC